MAPGTPIKASRRFHFAQALIVPCDAYFLVPQFSITLWSDFLPCVLSLTYKVHYILESDNSNVFNTRRLGPSVYNVAFLSTSAKEVACGHYHLVWALREVPFNPSHPVERSLVVQNIPESPFP